MWEKGGSFKRDGTYVYILLIPVDVWRKPTECCKATAAAAAKSLQSCLIPGDPIDSSPPGSAVPGILQARTPEWVAIPSPMHEMEK